jgi:drug/metabolite transporter (DMT)-like permease
MNGKTKIVVAMLIYGSIGLFVRGIELSSLQMAFLRATIGSVFLIVASVVMKKSLSFKIPKKKGWIYFLSGALLGINWLFLFKAFEYTSISNAILVYYLAPIIVILMSPLVLGEQLTLYKLLCMFTALGGLGMIVFNNLGLQAWGREGVIGIGFSLLAAFFYASVILINKRYASSEGLNTTVMQLLASALVLMPMMIVDNGFSDIVVRGRSFWMIVILGVVHTGVAYLLYFSSMKELDGQTVALYCYIDPISAVTFAWIFLGEGMNSIQFLGGALILGATYFIDFKNESYLSEKTCGYYN